VLQSPPRPEDNSSYEMCFGLKNLFAKYWLSISLFCMSHLRDLTPGLFD